MTPRLFLAPALLSLVPTWLHASENEWPQFRGPTGQGISAAVKVPVAWSTTTHIAWKVEVPGRGWSSPVLSRGRLYLTAAIGGDDGAALTLHALCIDAASGRTLWDTEVFQPDPAAAQAMHKKNSPASSTPIVAGERLYVHFGHMGTAALDLSGEAVWRQTDLKYPPVHGAGGSPVLAGDALVFSCDGERDPFVVALDAATGAIRWKTARNSPAKKQFAFSTPLAISVGGVQEIISPGSGFVGAYDAKDGREIWRVGYGEGYSIVPRPVFAHGLLFVSSGFDAPVLHAIRPEAASGDVTATNVAWSNRKAAPHTASPVVDGDEIYFVSDAGIATCADARTGEVHWSERLGGGFSASPVAAEGRIYFQNEAGVGFVVKAAKKFKLLATNDLAERSLASCAVADGTIFIRTEKQLWKIE
ncbi:MAG: PQQ-binding-like beta-propeller repeat protein [Chthoniobacteraceae bacterium]